MAHGQEVHIWTEQLDLIVSLFASELLSAIRTDYEHIAIWKGAGNEEICYRI